MLDEIELELQAPTQSVKEIPDSQASEAQCRAYLKAYVPSNTPLSGRPEITVRANSWGIIFLWIIHNSRNQMRRKRLSLPPATLAY